MTAPSRTRSCIMVVAWLSAVAVGAAACASSGYRYVKNSSVKTYFRVPHSWELYDQDAFVTRAGASQSPQAAERRRLTEWLVAFDGAPRPSVDHVLDDRSRHPAGIVRVRAIQESEKDTVSLRTMRNEIVQLDDLAQIGRVEPLEMADVVRPGGLRGVHEVHNVVGDSGRYLTIEQTVLVDPQTRLLYLIVVGCAADCFVANEKAIHDVVRSWTIKER